MSVVAYYFGHKDDLVAAIVSECYARLIVMMLPEVEAQDTAAGKLAAHIRTHLRYIDARRSHQVAITEIANTFRGRDGKRLADLNIDPAHRDALARIDLEVIFRLGVETGEFRDLSVKSMAIAVRSAIGGATVQTATDPGFDPVAYGEDLVDLIVRAVTA